MKFTKLIATLGTVAVLSLTGATVASASTTVAPAPAVKAASGMSPRIIAGSTADFSKVPFATQQYVNGRFNCSASIIAPTWVLLAKHCVEGKSASQMSLRVGSASLGGGTSIAAKSVSSWSQGDVALIELKTAYQGSYAPLGASNPSAGNPGDIYGWGAQGSGTSSPSKLKTASVTINGLDSSHWPGPAISQKGNSGQAYYGDSGGPLIVNGKVVGVCSGPVNDSDIGDPQGNVLYASVPASASWIKSVSGVVAK